MSKDKTNQKGITLIALVITIIVMLILVGVSVTVALNGGLFSTAQKATGDTKAERDNELALSDGKVTINGEEYNSIDEYVNGSGNETGGQKVTITPKKETYTVGEEVTIGTENFYVIADDANKVTLLAKYNLNAVGTTQSNATYTETGVGFSSTNYWSSETEYPLNLNDYTIPEGVTSEITTAKAYGEAKGGTGRLMTYEEATALATNNAGICYGTSINATDGYLNFWIGCAGDTDMMCAVRGGDAGDGTNESFITHGVYFPNNSFGVRPVIEISKSNIS